MNIKDAQLNPDRIEFLAIDGATGQVIAGISITREYYEKKRMDVVDAACKRLAQEVRYLNLSDDERAAMNARNASKQI